MGFVPAERNSRHALFGRKSAYNKKTDLCDRFFRIIHGGSRRGLSLRSVTGLLGGFR